MSSALPAIAAALALSSTPAWSQEASPPASTPEPAVSAPAPEVESTPVTIDESVTTTAAPEATTAPETPAPVAKPAKAKRTATKTPAPVRAARPAAAAPTPEPAVAMTAPAAAAPAAPIVDARPPETAQATAAPTADKPAIKADETTMMLGGGALALLALGAGAVAITRRRSDEDEVVEEPVTEETMVSSAPEPAPIAEEQPIIIAPSAFNWGKPQQADPTVERRTGETWVERAHRGPTPDNPSLSLRKRLKRAAFFDAREEKIAAGKAEPLPADAGLPENVAVPERELELA